MPEQAKEPKGSESQSTTSGKKPEVIVIPPRVVTKEDKTRTTKK
jgi:hypothetical protein